MHMRNTVHVVQQSISHFDHICISVQSGGSPKKPELSLGLFISRPKVECIESNHEAL